jgi:hypothetical protein
MKRVELTTAAADQQNDGAVDVAQWKLQEARTRLSMLCVGVEAFAEGYRPDVEIDPDVLMGFHAVLSDALQSVVEAEKALRS